MGAHWHIFLPIVFVIDEGLNHEFIKKFEKGYIEVERFKTKSYSPKLPDGTRLEFLQTNVRYEIEKKEDILSGFIDFFIDFYDLFRTSFDKKNTPMQNAFLIDEYNDFLLKLKSTNINKLEDVSLELRNIYSNYFLNYESITSVCVYEGYPIAGENFSQISGFSIMYSYFKMHENIETQHIFKTAVKLFTEKYSEKYPFSGSLIIIGY